MKKNIPGTKLFFLIMILVSNMPSAQTIDFQSVPSDKIQFGLSFDKPYYDGDVDVSTFTGVYQFSLNVPISSKFNLIGNIPYVSIKYEVDNFWGDYSYSKNGIGNIFVGLQTTTGINNPAKSIFSFGLYLPTADEVAAVNGIFTDYYNLSNYVIDYVGLYFNYAYHKQIEKRLNFALEVGPDIIIPTEGDGADTELLMHYGINGGIHVNQLAFNLELLGSVMLSEDTDDFGDRFVHLINLGANYNVATNNLNIIPKIFYRYYLKEDIRNMIDGVLGLGVTVSLD